MSGLLALLGLSGLFLSLARHQRDLIGHMLDRRWCRSLRLAGGALLVLSVIAALGQGGAMGLLWWLGMVSVETLAIALIASIPALRS